MWVMEAFDSERIDKAVMELLKAVTEQPGYTTVSLRRPVDGNDYVVTVNNSREYKIHGITGAD